ncbi:hypothetical protein EV175_003117 [Coemansia sp. RSA 1933]|nr:hypothetical protein EV175_003117 [Coemansia sp. RSA 1933]
MVGKSAAMLESLIIRNYDMQDLRSFFFDETDRAIIYPRLRKLGFYNDDRFRGEEKFRVNKEISVFPVLRSLKWQSEYIFDDDTLFRGNSDTLKKLDIELGKDLVQVLQRYSVFSNGRYSQLCHVSTQDAGINSTMRISANEHVRLGVSLIVPETKFFSFSGYRLSDLEIISESPYLENIQVLRLTEAEVSLKSLFGLVKLLPNVTKLAFSPVIMDMIPTGDQFERVVFNLYNQYYPLSHHLRHWEYLGEFTEGGGISVLYNLLAIVTVCPSFVSAFIPSNYKKGLERSVKGTAKRGLYNKHIIGKVQRIVRNMS